MNDQEMKQKLALYLEATEKLATQTSSGHPVDVKEQKKLFLSVITEMGVSAEDQLELEKVGQQFFSLSKESYREGNYQQSVHFCEKALEILPFEVEILELLMETHLKLSQQSQAQSVADSILKIHPSHKEALRIKHTLPTLSSSSADKKIWFGIAAIFFVVLGLVVMNMTQNTPATLEPISKEKTTATSNDKKTEKPSNLSSPDLTLKTDNLPISVVGMVDGITLENRDTEFSKYNDSFAYHLRLVLTNVGKNEIAEIEGKLTLFDAQNAVVEEELFDAKEDFKPILRPGESYGIEELIYKKVESIPNITKARFEITKIKQTPAPKSISKEPVDLEWEKGHPEQFSITVQRRISERKLGTESILSKVYARSEYEITNTGTGVIKLLQLQDDYYDENNNHLGKGHGYVTLTSYPHIAPNETRVISIGSDLSKIATTVRTSVVEVR